MKRILLSIVAAATLSFSSFGQAPEGFKYQAVVRDAGNIILNNQTVGLRMTIQQGSIGGTTVYAETFAPTTNAYGLVNLEIGNGTLVSGTFANIDWSAGPYFMETAVDVTGGTNYAVMGTSQLMSVPYALYAKTSGNGAGPQGPAGANGLDGANGIDGLNGATGAQGPAGLDGVQGPQGIPGVQGANGPQGPIGLTGAAGATGAAGSDGTNGTNGTDGATGLTGPIGPQGATGLTGAQGPIGLTGATGAAGAAGTNGTNGTDGATGLTGLTGPAGADGTNGTNGTNGIDGATGLQGSAGPQGTQGLTGAQGPIGNDGAVGATGPQGPIGNDGAIGATGPQGPIGNDGAVGATGAQGTIGLTGPQGPIGNDGSSAYELYAAANVDPDLSEAAWLASLTGADGIDGNDGAAGATGATGADGQGGVTTAGSGINVTGAGTIASPYVVSTTSACGLSIGDTYQGGIIFYLDATGCHGLIAAPSDQSTGIQWYNGSYSVTNAVRDGIGAGEFNTERIIAYQATGAYAAQICANYQGGNYGDWYLPSKYELNLMYLSIGQGNALGLGNIGGFASSPYWSSTESGTSSAWYYNFGNGVAYSFSAKLYAHYVRAVRAF
jgi:hypothetical protein